MSGVYPATVTLSHILSVDADSWGKKDSPVFKTPLPRTGGKEIKAWLSKAGTRIYLKLETSQPLIIAEYSCSILNDKESAVVLHTIKGENAECFSRSITLILSLSEVLTGRCDRKEIIVRVNATVCYCTLPGEPAITEPCMVPLAEELYILYKDEVFTDVTIVSQGKEFKAHKVVLASQSSVFRKMFEVDMTEKETNMVEMPDISPPVISDLLDFIYTGEAPNIKTLAKELLNIADKYELPKLFSMCQEELRKNIESDVTNVIEMFSFAKLHNAEDLKRACVSIITLNIDAVQNSPGWACLTSAEEAKVLLIDVISAMK